MTSQTVASFSTIDELIRHLGGVPPDRVRLRPAPGAACEEDMLRLYSREKRLFELVDGVLVEKAMGFYEAYLAGLLLQHLNNFLDAHDLGITAGADGMMRLAPGLVRIPDVSFVRWERIPGRKVPRDSIAGLAPDLAVEVLSESNTRAEMERKVGEYFRAGTRLVWLLLPDEGAFEVHASPEESTLLREGDTLDGGDVLPGFSLSVSDFFARARREGPSQ